MSKKRKTFINVAKVLFVCLVVVLGVAIFTNKDTTVTKKNTKETKIENFQKKSEKEQFVAMKNRIEFKNKLDENLNKKVLPKNNFKRIRFKNEDKMLDETSTNSKIEVENVETEDSYMPHWVHNHANGVICKSCTTKPLEKNQKRFS